MPATRRPDISFTRLGLVDQAEILAHMTDPRVAIHMPLLTEPWTEEICAAFIAAKEACWHKDGLGHWAFLNHGRYVGWGGFQREGAEWDFGLVLKPDAFGLGLPIAKKALAYAKADDRIGFVTFLLSPSRRHLGALDRIGARQLPDAEHGGVRFLKFRLDTG